MRVEWEGLWFRDVVQKKGKANKADSPASSHEGAAWGGTIKQADGPQIIWNLEFDGKQKTGQILI